MTTTWYSVNISIQNVGSGNTNVSYYFSFDTENNLVTGFYNYNNIGVNLLFPTPPSLPYFSNNFDPNPPPFFSLADNVFDPSTLLFSAFSGIDFSDTYLQQQPLQYDVTTQTTPFYPAYPFFSIYSDLETERKNFLWTYAGPDTTYSYNTVLLNSMNIQLIAGPPTPPVPCFLSNTQILTINGYQKIQDLKKGDLVKTLTNDFVPVYLVGKKDIHHLALNERAKDQLYKCSHTEYPEIFEDLIITGSHSILVDKFCNKEQEDEVLKVNEKIYITENKYRLPVFLDKRASIYEVKGIYTIYHVALENENYFNNYGIYANGLLVETCSKRYLKELSNMVFLE